MNFNKKILLIVAIVSVLFTAGTLVYAHNEGTTAIHKHFEFGTDNSVINLQGISVGTSTINAGSITFGDGTVFNQSNAGAAWTTNASGIHYSNGSVGINDNTPRSRLDVNGNIYGSIYYDYDNSNYYVNPSGNSSLSGFLGIGTTDPDRNLHISGSTQREILITDTSGATNQKNISLINVNGAFLLRQYNDDLTIRSTVLTIGASTGDLSVNNNKITNLGAPATSTDAATKSYVDSVVGEGGTAEDLYVNETGDTMTGALSINQTGGEFRFIGGNRDMGMFSSGDFLILGEWAGGTNRLYINTSNGRFGVGETTPAYRLQVSETTATDSTPLIVADFTATYSGGAPSSGFGSAIRLTNERVSSGTDYVQLEAITNASSEEEFAINVNGTRRLYIDSAGDVGIGTTNPSSVLDVNGQISGFTSLYNNSGNLVQPKLVMHSTSNGDIWTSQGAYISIGESGNLGGASTHLTYRGDGRGFVGAGSVTNGAPSGGSYFEFVYNSANILTNSQLDMNNKKIVDLGAPAASTDAATKSYVDSSAIWTTNASGIHYPDPASPDSNVGIGTSTPQTQLHIYDGSILDATNNLLTLEGYSGDVSATPEAIAIHFKTSDSNSNAASSIRHATVNDNDYGDNDEGAGNLIFNTTNGGTPSDKMIITGRGDIGMGILNPTEKLNVNGNIKVEDGGRVYFDRPNGSTVGAIGWEDDSVFYVAGHPDYGSTAGNDVRVYGFGSDIHLGDSANGDVLTVRNSNGSVGVGTVSPTNGALHVYRGTSIGAFPVTLANAVLRVEEPTTNLYIDGNGIVSSGADFYFGTATNNNIVFGVNNAEVARLNTSGDFDITNNKIVNLATPATSTDAATKGYVDSAVIPDTTCDGSTCNVTNTGTLDGFNGSDLVAVAGDTMTGNLTMDGIIAVDRIDERTGQQLVLNAGESASYATGQTNEWVYVNAEGGIQVNTSPDDWGSGWAGRDTTSITGTSITVDGNTVYHTGNISGASVGNADACNGDSVCETNSINANGNITLGTGTGTAEILMLAENSDPDNKLRMYYDYDSATGLSTADPAFRIYSVDNAGANNSAQLELYNGSAYTTIIRASGQSEFGDDIKTIGVIDSTADDWGITGCDQVGGTGIEDLCFYEPEEGNKIWGYIDDDVGLKMTGAPGVYASGDVQGDRFLDDDNTSYYLDPDNSGVSANLNGRITINRDGQSGDVIQIEHVENSDWPFIFRTSSVGNDNASGFWVNSDGTPDMRLRATDNTITALIHSNGTSYLNGGDVGIGTTNPNGHKLYVNGTAWFEGAIHQQLVGGRIEYETDASSRDWAYWNRGATRLWSAWIDSNDDLKFNSETGGDFKVSGGTGSMNLFLEADTNNSGESNVPSIKFNQDGNAIEWTIGSNSSNNFEINQTLGSGSDIDMGGSDVINVGKLDANTVDPVYTINGTKYATYMAGMVGLKEETTGVIESNKFTKSDQYKGVEHPYITSYTIDFSNLEGGSDLWLFAQAINMGNRAHITEEGKVYKTTPQELFNNFTILLSAGFNGDVWYEKDVDNKTITIYTEVDRDKSNIENMEVSYRFTAPRFDWKDWSNYTDTEHDGLNLDKLLD